MTPANNYKSQFSVFILSILCVTLSFSQVKQRSLPSWISQQSYEKSPDINDDEISYGLLTLLSDQQVNVPKQEQFVRLAYKITDNVGVQDGSLISVNYDPTYQELFLHHITITRDDKEINKLNVNDFQTIRQESNSESYIYDGSLNATANLSDIRSGDIIDYSYTIKGFNPIGRKFSSTFTLNDYQPVGKIHVNILSKNKLNTKIINSELEPVIASKNGLKTYSWTNTNTKAPEFEENTPSWYLMYETLFVSEYENWNQVVDWAIPIYTKDNQLSKGLKQKIKEIENATEYEHRRVKMALKFVQNEVRYLGLESGIGAYKTFKPNKVFEQRFGDCKDKTWLLVNMLREMKIEAYPVLINSVYGESLTEFLPSPNAFDHVIVKVIDSSKTGKFFDPTISNQEGHFSNISIPNYNNGLVLKKGNIQLEAVINENEDLVEVYDTYDVTSIGGDMTLKVITVYHQGEADIMRTSLKSNSINSLNKEYQNYYKNLFDEVEILEEMTFEDDTLYNTITVEESYKFKDVWEPMVGDESKIGVGFTPYGLYNSIVFPTERERKTPFALYYPAHRKHNITIKLPTKWGITKNEKQVVSNDFNFKYNAKANGSNNILYVNYTYKNKSLYVSSKDFETFYDDYKKMEEYMSYYIYIPKSQARFSNLFKNKKDDVDTNEDTAAEDSSIESIGIGFVALIFLGIIGLMIYITISNRKHRD